MAEITADGYTALRVGPSPNDWFLELRDDGGAPVTVAGAARTQGVATDNPGASTLTLVLTVTGADLATLPTTVESVVGFAAVSGGNALTAVETFAPFTFADALDEAAFAVHVEAPDQP